jgi:hypothetical protein
MSAVLADFVAKVVLSLSCDSRVEASDDAADASGDNGGQAFKGL